MEQEKIKEIKKALQDCASNEIANKLPYIDDHKCKAVAFADILTLINELESENEKLKQHKRELQGGQQDLIKRVAELENEKKEHSKKKFLRGWKLGIEEFSERLKDKFEHCVGDIYYADTIDERVDETLKEVINE